MGNRAPKAGGDGEKGLLDQYDLGQQIGSGVFGVVFSCTHRITRKELAVKLVDRIESPQSILAKEPKMMAKLRHENIIKCHGVFHERFFVCILLDKFEGGNMMQAIRKQKHKSVPRFIPTTIVHIFKQMAQAVSYIQSANIIHRDIRGANFLMTQEDLMSVDNKIVLCDFGLAIELESGSTRLREQVGSRAFWAPEVANKDYGIKADVWALAVLYYGLVVGKPPFKSEHEALGKPPKHPLKVQSPQEDMCKALIMGMLEKTESKRLGMAAVAAHPWMARFPRSLQEIGVVAEDDEGIWDDFPVDESNKIVKERRYDLVEVMTRESSARMKGYSQQFDPETFYYNPYAFVLNAFSVPHKGLPHHRLRYAWKVEAYAEEQGILKVDGTPELLSPVTEDHVEVFKEVLTKAGVKVGRFGKGNAKTLQQLAQEEKDGHAQFMLDVSSHQKMLRVIDKWKIKLRSSDADYSDVLVEVGPDGTLQLPSGTKLAHESSRDCALQFLKCFPGEIWERSFMAGESDRPPAIRLYLSDEKIEEQRADLEEYPGIETLYRSHIMDAAVVAMDPETRAHVKCLKRNQKDDETRHAELFELSPGGEAPRKTYAWDPGSGHAKGRWNHYGEPTQVGAATMDVDELALEDRLVQGGIDVEQFGEGTCTVKNFAQELEVCETSLEASDDTLVRVAHIVQVKLYRKDGYEVLLQKEVLDASGTRVAGECLPAKKKKPYANPFHVARDLLSKDLRIPEHQIQFEYDFVERYVEETFTVNYPAIKTVYHHEIVSARLTKQAEFRLQQEHGKKGFRPPDAPKKRTSLRGRTSTEDPTQFATATATATAPN